MIGFDVGGKIALDVAVNKHRGDLGMKQGLNAGVLWTMYQHNGPGNSARLQTTDVALWCDITGVRGQQEIVALRHCLQLNIFENIEIEGAGRVPKMGKCQSLLGGEEVEGQHASTPLYQI